MCPRVYIDTHTKISKYQCTYIRKLQKKFKNEAIEKQTTYN